MTTLLGAMAGLLTTSCWLPQLLRSWRTRSTADISWTYLAVLTSGVGLWIGYGILIGDGAVIATNTATATALLTLGAFKRRFDLHPVDSRPPARALDQRRSARGSTQSELPRNVSRNRRD